MPDIRVTSTVATAVTILNWTLEAASKLELQQSSLPLRHVLPFFGFTTFLLHKWTFLPDIYMGLWWHVETVPSKVRYPDLLFCLILNLSDTARDSMSVHPIQMILVLSYTISESVSVYIILMILVISAIIADSISGYPNRIVFIISNWLTDTPSVYPEATFLDFPDNCWVIMQVLQACLVPIINTTFINWVQQPI